MRWRRLDVPGHEDASIRQTTDGWRLAGRLEVEEQGTRFVLRYDIACDARWHTRSALIEGTAADQPVRIALAADGEGHWTREGNTLPDLEGALDVDLGFTPATNTLPIRRLALPVGGAALVRCVWLRFPELELELMQQTYTRESERVYRYLAQVDGEPFSARLDVDHEGRVLKYEGLWEAISP
jgi:hypothetical protein